MGRESKVINHREEETKERKRENKIRKQRGTVGTRADRLLIMKRWAGQVSVVSTYFGLVALHIRGH